MKYRMQYDEKGNLLAIGTNIDGTEITEAEYNELLTMIRAKAALEDSLYNGEITIEDVPSDWREEIQRRVDERIEWEATQPVAEDEA